MSRPLRIAQISDTHINSTDELNSGVDVRRHMQDVLKVLKTQPIDLLVISGDLAAVNGEAEAYDWIREQLGELPFPVALMAGNHDHPGRMMAHLDIPAEDYFDGMLCFVRQFGNRRLIFLDTSTYQLPETQITWLASQMAADPSQPVLLFMHHPPLLCGHLFMDSKHSLHNLDASWSALTQWPGIRHIFCGHYHTDDRIERDGRTVYITPSTMLQINKDSPVFKIARVHPGWRIIEWFPSGEVCSWTNYLT